MRGARPGVELPRGRAVGVAPGVRCGGAAQAREAPLDGNFSEKFSFNRHHVHLKSWWLGDITASSLLLTDWSQDMMEELPLAIPAEISERRAGRACPRPAGAGPGRSPASSSRTSPGEAGASGERRAWKMDQLYQRKMFFPGYFPNELRAFFWQQVQLLQNAIVESRLDCERHCGTFQYETISCTDSYVICFGYNCNSSTQRETAVQGLLLYM
ncbi:hypothetical protein MC885_002618 [Smutsia gigantea]|nr:hypothetical protein MC885_002618 [Smutsia gigantea]